MTLKGVPAFAMMAIVGLGVQAEAHRVALQALVPRTTRQHTRNIGPASRADIRPHPLGYLRMKAGKSVPAIRKFRSWPQAPCPEYLRAAQRGHRGLETGHESTAIGALRSVISCLLSRGSDAQVRR